MSVSRGALNYGEWVKRGSPIASGNSRLPKRAGLVHLGARIPSGLVVVRVEARDGNGRTAVHESVAIAGDELPMAAAIIATALATRVDGYVHGCDRRTAKAVDCNVAYLEGEGCCAARYRVRWRPDGQVAVRRFRNLRERRVWIGGMQIVRLR